VTDGPWDVWLAQALARLDRAEQRRSLHAISPSGAVEARRDGRDLVLFATNDYLGLSVHPEVRAAASEAALAHGMGPRGAALVAGYTDAHRDLEEALARLERTESALLFPTGFAANSAVIAALADAELEVFSDALNHASIVDGCRMARRLGATVTVYPHRDTARLGELLTASRAGRKLVVTDAVFSMDGTLAPLVELVALRERHGALLVVDEAHATLVFGPHGGGLADALGVADGVDIHVGTLSKAFGALGGFAATTRVLRDWLLNRARPFVFSTALPLPVVAAARAALDVATRSSDVRDRLWARVAQLAGALGRRLECPVVPIAATSEAHALAASRALLERGLFVPAIRPPTVPAGGSRLRIALSAAHTEAQVARLASALAELGLAGRY